MGKKFSGKKVIQGRWYKINKKIKKRITAKYHKIKDWVMDPKGYFLIAIDRKKKILRVGYCIFKKLGNKPINDMVSIVSGKTAIEIVNTLIREKFISERGRINCSLRENTGEWRWLGVQFVVGGL